MAVLLLLGTAWAGPKKGLDCIGDHESAVEIARTRGKLILLTVIVDGDGENRMVVDSVFRDREFRKIAKEFVILYANNDDDHGKVKTRDESGKRVLRCADCPAITCEQHMVLAQSYARGFYPGNEARTPIHFVLDENEEKVDTIMNGNFEAGFNHVPAKRLVSRLKALLQKYGKGLSEKQYEEMQRNLTDARAARARGKSRLELEKLLEVTALTKEVEGVRQAKARLQEIDREAAKELARAEALASERKWEEALDAMRKLVQDYPGTLTAAAAAKKQKEISGLREVKRLLKARDLYRKGLEFKEKGKTELAKKRFEKCLRLYRETKYGQLADVELGKLK